METPHPHPSRVRILGEPIDLVTPAAVMGFAARRVAGRQKGLVLAHDAHSVALARRHPQMRAAYARADLVALRSRGLGAWGRLTGKGVRRTARASYADWRDDFWGLAGRHRWRVLLLGDAPGMAGRAAAVLAARAKGAEIAVCDAGDGERDLIAAFRPDVLLVDMEAERLAAWIGAHYEGLASGVVLAASGAFATEIPEEARQVDLPAAIDRRLLAPLSLTPQMARDVLDLFEAREGAAAGNLRLY